MAAVMQHASAYLERFSSLQAGRDSEPNWLRERRELAMERFLRMGVPTPRDEEYKYTDLRALSDGRFLLSPDEPGGHARPAHLAGQRIAAACGDSLAVAGPAPPGIRVMSLSEALVRGEPRLEDRLASIASIERHALCALNTALFEDGVVIVAEAGADSREPLHLEFGPGRVARLARVLIIAERSSRVTVVETYSGLGEYWRNAVTEIHVSENARVDHVRAQLESPQAFHTGVVQAGQERDSRMSSFSLSFGARVARNDIGTRLDGTGCDCSLDGLYAVRGHQLVDHHTGIDHAMPHCHSHQLYKGVLDGNARGVFNGKIFVRRDAQKTDAVQSNKNLLLSDSAEVNTKPQLEIDANDVRCTHGATIGQLDADAAFYLRSRGIGEAEARKLLTYAFATDALARVGVASLRERFEGLLLDRFAPEAA